MSYQFPPDLSRMVHDKLATGQYASEDEVLLDAMRALADRDEAIAGIQAGIEDMQSGRLQGLDDSNPRGDCTENGSDQGKVC